MATEFVVLGSGTAVPTPERGAAGYLLNTCKSSSMLDCGPGSTRKLPLVGRELIDVDRVLISHFHTDHVCDLSAFIFG
ncbi:MAG: ribonuclease Z, partial [Blastocatellia bacterium]|nr:ribonuclease Z [Blastocatellia bacterium]